MAEVLLNHLWKISSLCLCEEFSEFNKATVMSMCENRIENGFILQMQDTEDDKETSLKEEQSNLIKVGYQTIF